MAPLKLRTIRRWLGIAAELYVLFTVIIFSFNIATIFVIRGREALTPDLLYYIFARDAAMAIGFTVVGCGFMSYFLKSIRRPKPDGTSGTPWPF